MFCTFAVSSREFVSKLSIPINNRSKTIVGIFSDENRIQSVSRGKNKYYIVDPKDSLNAELGELVVAKLLPTRKHEVPKAKVLELLGRVNKIHTFSQIAIHLHDIPHEFSKEQKQETLNEKNFDENAKSEFLKGAQIAYETIITVSYTHLTLPTSDLV